MHLVLDAAQDAAHGDWLRQMPGAYEWWYFDAVSEDGAWSLACIWFLGNPFSPYYRLSLLRQDADPYVHNALFFALYRRGHLHAYHFTCFPPTAICADEVQPASLHFGPNHLSYDNRVYRLRLDDENANRRTMQADLRFAAPSLLSTTEERTAPQATGEESTHFWLPAAPICHVSGEVTLRELNNHSAERIRFTGDGYHDHNWGTLPFAADIRDWYWARAALPGDRAAVLYHVDFHRPKPSVSHLLLFEQGLLLRHDPHAHVTRQRLGMNIFGTGYASLLEAVSGDVQASFSLETRMDSAPFYVRALSHAAVTQAGRTEQGRGVAEYFRPRLLGTQLVASATKARIVMR